MLESLASHARRACEAREKKTDRIFSVSPQSRSLFSASFQTFHLTARAYLNTQKYGLFCSLYWFSDVIAEILEVSNDPKLIKNKGRAARGDR